MVKINKFSDILVTNDDNDTKSEGKLLGDFQDITWSCWSMFIHKTLFNPVFYFDSGDVHSGNVNENSSSQWKSQHKGSQFGKKCSI